MGSITDIVINHNKLITDLRGVYPVFKKIERLPIRKSLSFYYDMLIDGASFVIKEDKLDINSSSPQELTYFMEIRTKVEGYSFPNTKFIHCANPENVHNIEERIELSYKSQDDKVPGYRMGLEIITRPVKNNEKRYSNRIEEVNILAEIDKQHIMDIARIWSTSIKTEGLVRVVDYDRREVEKTQRQRLFISVASNDYNVPFQLRMQAVFDMVNVLLAQANAVYQQEFKLPAFGLYGGQEELFRRMDR